MIDDGIAGLVQGAHKVLVRLENLFDELLVFLVHGEQILHELDVKSVALKIVNSLKPKSLTCLVSRKYCTKTYRQSLVLDVVENGVDQHNQRVSHAFQKLVHVGQVLLLLVLDHVGALAI